MAEIKGSSTCANCARITKAMLHETACGPKETDRELGYTPVYPADWAKNLHLHTCDDYISPAQLAAIVSFKGLNR